MNYNNITIEQFQKLSNCIILNSEKIEDSQIVNTFKLGQDILNIFEGVEHTDSGQWMVDEFNKRLEKYAFLNEPIQSDSWVKVVKVGGKDYKVKQTPDKWNVGQFVSMAYLTKRHEDIMNNSNLTPENIIDIPTIANYAMKERNQDKAYDEGLTPCPCCGRGIKDDNKKFFIHSIYGAATYPASDNNQYADAWDMAVGSECAKKFPKGYVFTVE